MHHKIDFKMNPNDAMIQPPPQSPEYVGVQPPPLQTSTQVGQQLQNIYQE